MTVKTGSHASAICSTRSRAEQFGIMYDALIIAIRAEIPKPAEMVYAKVTDVSTSDERQKVTLSNGETISARLVVLANGLNVGLRRSSASSARSSAPVIRSRSDSTSCRSAARRSPFRR